MCGCHSRRGTAVLCLDDPLYIPRFEPPTSYFAESSHDVTDLVVEKAPRLYLHKHQRVVSGEVAGAGARVHLRDLNSIDNS